MRVWIAVISLLIVISGTTAIHTAAASNDDLAVYESYAEQLKELGLFQGTDNGFELDREPNRLEAVVMLIRLLGKEQEAQAQAPGAHPFRDVPAWADRYVSYAYQHKLAAGVAADQFGSEQFATAEQYCTFVLRALGYDDASGDFVWHESLQKAAEIGLKPHRDYASSQGSFLRAHMVDISYHSLTLKLKNQDVSLQEKLENDGAIAPTETVEEEDTPALPGVGGEDDMPESPIIGEEDVLVTVPVKLEQSVVLGMTTTSYTIDKSSFTQHFPDADTAYIHHINTQIGDVRLTEEDQLKIAILYALTSGDRMKLHDPNREVILPLTANQRLLNSVSLWDKEGHILAIALPVTLSPDHLTLTFLVGESSIMQKVQPEWQQIVENSQGAQYVSNSIFYARDDKPQSTDTGQLQQSKPLFIDRAALPDAARSFTHIMTVSYPDEAGRQIAKDANNIAKEVEKTVKRSFLMSQLGIQTARLYSEEDGLADLFQERRLPELNLPISNIGSMQPTLVLVLLQDEQGKVLAYSYFNEDDIKRLK